MAVTLYWADFSLPPLGRVILASTERGLCYFGPCGPRGEEGSGEGRERFWRWVRRHLSSARPVRDEARHGEAVSQLLRYLAGELKAFWIDLDLRGTPFQRSVWAVAQAIPYGSTLSYREVAARAGRPRASRAVGRAMGANPLPLFIPCHRVIRADGTPGGFGWGREWKHFLLELEKSGAGRGGEGLRFVRLPSDT